MSKHVVIVGGGLIGLSAAYACLRRGHKATVLERSALNRDGCSFGNAGMIVPSHFIPLAAPGMVALGLKWMWNPESPFYIKPRLSWDLLTWGFHFWAAATPARVRQAAPLLRDLHLASREGFQEYAAEGLEFGFAEKGLMMLCKTEHALEEEARTGESARRLGIPCEILDAMGAARLEPNVEMDIAGAVYFPKDCHLQPERLMASLEQAVHARGGKILSEAEVSGWRSERHRVAAVTLKGRGELEADEFIIAGGSWSPKVAYELGLRLPMQAGRGYSLTLHEPRQQPAICSILAEARVACTPMGNQLRFGGTMEIAGMNGGSINARRVRGIVKAVPQYFPAFRETDFEHVEPWSGLRPCSPDGLPYLGRTAAVENVIVATAHAMLGVSLAPVTGRIVAALVDGDELPIDVSLLSPDRYA